MSDPGRVKSPNDRLAELEFLFTHLERQVAELNAVLLQQQRRTEQIEKDLRLLRTAQEGDAPVEELEP